MQIVMEWAIQKHQIIDRALISNGSYIPNKFKSQHKIASKNKLNIAVALPPDMNFFPREWSKLSRNGKSLNEFIISDSQANEILKSLISSAALAYLKTGFLISNANNLNLQIFTNAIDPSTGNQADIILCQIKISKDVFLGVNIDMVEPVAAMETLSAKLNYPKYENSYLKFGKSPKSLFDFSKLNWTDINDQEVEKLNIDLVKEIKECYNKVFGKIKKKKT